MFGRKNKNDVRYEAAYKNKFTQSQKELDIMKEKAYNNLSREGKNHFGNKDSEQLFFIDYLKQGVVEMNISYHKANDISTAFSDEITLRVTSQSKKGLDTIVKKLDLMLPDFVMVDAREIHTKKLKYEQLHKY